jgi:hypothetical protein
MTSPHNEGAAALAERLQQFRRDRLLDLSKAEDDLLIEVLLVLRGAHGAGASVPGRFVDMPKLIQDVLLAYQARPCDPLAADVVRAVLSAYGVRACDGGQQ